MTLFNSNHSRLLCFLSEIKINSNDMFGNSQSPAIARCTWPTYKDSPVEVVEPNVEKVVEVDTDDFVGNESPTSKVSFYKITMQDLPFIWTFFCTIRNFDSFSCLF